MRELGSPREALAALPGISIGRLPRKVEFGKLVNHDDHHLIVMTIM